MVIGIDAANIRSGGGLAHLAEILKEADPLINKFEKIIVWSSTKTLNSLPSAPWLIKKSCPMLNKTIIHSTIWKFFKRDNIVRNSNCNVLFLVDATYSRFHPSVTICHNILPFSNEAISNFKFRDQFLIGLMRINALAAFRGADKVIMLSNDSINVVSNHYNHLSLKSVLIPHGFDNYFKPEGMLRSLKGKKSYRLIYVSTLSPYKLQWKVISATYRLLDLGYDVELTLVGSALNGAKALVDEAIILRPEYSANILYKGEVSNQELPMLLTSSDIFVFASLCETFGITLLEAMATGIHIACSNRSAMPEILKENGSYFNPNDETDIARAIIEIINNPDEAEAKSANAVELAKTYSWERCTKQTFEVLIQEGSRVDK